MNNDYKDLRANFYKSYSNEELNKELDAFFSQHMDLSSFNSKGKNSNKLMNHFFATDVYAAKNIRYPFSPDDVLNNDDMLNDIFEYIATKPNFYTGDDLTNLKSFFRNGTRYARKVACFSPNTARKIYEYLCPVHNSNILDYSCGFGGRMLGAISSPYNYKYYGIEPNTKLFNHLNDFGEFISQTHSIQYKLFNQGSELFLPELVDLIDLAFSSPPYFNMETYTDEPTQSLSKYPDYNDWLDGYVLSTLKNIYLYVRPNGIFAVNIKNLTYNKKYKLLDDWIALAQQVGFKQVDILDMSHQSGKIALAKYEKTRINGYEYQGAQEPIAVFKK